MPTDAATADRQKDTLPRHYQFSKSLTGIQCVFWQLEVARIKYTRAMNPLLDLTALPADFVDNPYTYYARLRRQSPVHAQSDGSFLISSYQLLEQIYKDTRRFSSDKKQIFKPKFGDSALYDHHTTSLVFNDPPLHTRVRKIMVGAMTPRAIADMETALVSLVDTLLEELPLYADQGVVDVVKHFACRIPINIIGNLFNMPIKDREPLRDWSLAILGALEPAVSEEQQALGNKAVCSFCDYLRELVADRRRHPGDRNTDVLTRLIEGHGGQLSEAELLHNCIFTLNAGHETTTNLIASALNCLHENPHEKQRLINNPSLIGTAVDECLRLESPNQLGNRLTSMDVVLGDTAVAAGTNLHLIIGAANRDHTVFVEAEKMNIARKPNRHLAFAGGPHACLGLNLARMEGRIAIGRFIERFPDYSVTGVERSQRVRFRGMNRLLVDLGGT